VSLLLLPPIVVFTGATPIRTSVWQFLAVFGITYSLQQLALSQLSRGYHHPISSVRFEVMRLSSSIAATLNLFARRARTFRVTPKGRTGDRRRRTPIPGDLRLLLGITVAAFVWFALAKDGVVPLHYSSASLEPEGKPAQGFPRHPVHLPLWRGAAGPIKM
jgi:hypothetical protein